MREGTQAYQLEALALAEVVRARRCGRQHEVRAALAAAEAFRRRAMEMRASAAGRARPALQIVRLAQPDPEAAAGSA